MAKKKQEPMITHTEILSRAIRQMEAELESWETRMAGKPDHLIKQRIRLSGYMADGLPACDPRLVPRNDTLLQLINDAVGDDLVQRFFHLFGLPLFDFLIRL